MTDERIYLELRSALEVMRVMSPYRTGNLRHNALKLESIGPRRWHLYVDESIAPYMPYTNEPWDIRIIEQGVFKKGQKRAVVRTWQNPNEGWWNKAVEIVAQRIASNLGGTLRRK